MYDIRYKVQVVGWLYAILVPLFSLPILAQGTATIQAEWILKFQLPLIFIAVAGACEILDRRHNAYVRIAVTCACIAVAAAGALLTSARHFEQWPTIIAALAVYLLYYPEEADANKERTSWRRLLPLAVTVGFCLLFTLSWWTGQTSPLALAGAIGLTVGLVCGVILEKLDERLGVLDILLWVAAIATAIICARQIGGWQGALLLLACTAFMNAWTFTVYADDVFTKLEPRAFALFVTIGTLVGYGWWIAVKGNTAGVWTEMALMLSAISGLLMAISMRHRRSSVFLDVSYAGGSTALGTLDVGMLTWLLVMNTQMSISYVGWLAAGTGAIWVWMYAIALAEETTWKHFWEDLIELPGFAVASLIDASNPHFD